MKRTSEFVNSVVRTGAIMFWSIGWPNQQEKENTLFKTLQVNGYFDHLWCLVPSRIILADIQKKFNQIRASCSQLCLIYFGLEQTYIYRAADGRERSLFQEVIDLAISAFGVENVVVTRTYDEIESVIKRH
jgi:hypothetical protein